MYKPIILLSLITLLYGCSASYRAPEALTGRWEGIAETPRTKTKVIIDFTPNADGSLSATITVPDERLLNKPLINLRYEPPDVHFELQTSERKIIFDGSRKEEAISGTVNGGETSGPISLRHVGIVPPTPYAQQDVSFRNGDVILEEPRKHLAPAVPRFGGLIRSPSPRTAMGRRPLEPGRSRCSD